MNYRSSREKEIDKKVCVKRQKQHPCGIGEGGQSGRPVTEMASEMKNQVDRILLPQSTHLQRLWWTAPKSPHEDVVTLLFLQGVYRYHCRQRWFMLDTNVLTNTEHYTCLEKKNFQAFHTTIITCKDSDFLSEWDWIVLLMHHRKIAIKLTRFSWLAYWWSSSIM